MQMQDYDIIIGRVEDIVQRSRRFKHTPEEILRNLLVLTNDLQERQFSLEKAIIEDSRDLEHA